MSNSFQPTCGVTGAFAPASVGFLNEVSKVEIEPKPAIKFEAERAIRLDKAEKL